jgi:hypothetical protein
LDHIVADVVVMKKTAHLKSLTALLMTRFDQKSEAAPELRERAPFLPPEEVGVEPVAGDRPDDGLALLRPWLDEGKRREKRSFDPVCSPYEPIFLTYETFYLGFFIYHGFLTFTTSSRIINREDWFHEK